MFHWLMIHYFINPYVYISPFPSFQYKLEQMREVIDTNNFQIAEHPLEAWIEPKIPILSPWMYFSLRTTFHQSFSSLMNLQAISSPIALFLSIRSLIPTPPWFLGCFTVSHLIKWNFYVPTFPRSHRCLQISFTKIERMLCEAISDENW